MFKHDLKMLAFGRRGRGNFSAFMERRDNGYLLIAQLRFVLLVADLSIHSTALPLSASWMAI